MSTHKVGRERFRAIPGDFEPVLLIFLGPFIGVDLCEDDEAVLLEDALDPGARVAAVSKGLARERTAPRRMRYSREPRGSN